MSRLGLAAMILGASLGALPARAGSLGEAGGETAASPASRPDARWHLYGGLGYGAASGGYGAFLEEPVQFELRIAKSYRSGAWRLGGGLQFGSLDMLPPYEEQKEWAHLQTFGTVTRVFRPQESFRPYLQGRVGLVRVHPRSEIFYNKPSKDLDRVRARRWPRTASASRSSPASSSLSGRGSPSTSAPSGPATTRRRTTSPRSAARR